MLSRTDAATQGVEALEIVLTAACNLSCAYCYQNDKKPRSMAWDTLRGALDLLLRSRSPEVEVLFLGGEPLLEFPLIRRAVEYVQAARPDKAVRYLLITNGTLMGEEQAQFVDQHGMSVQLSFDGVAGAQDLRARGTFRVLDDLLDRLARDHPRLFRERLTVSLTLTSAMIPHLASSIDYFLRKGVPEISLAPIVTHDPGWTDDTLATLDAQFSRVLDACLGRYFRTGEVPLLAFRDGTAAQPSRRLVGAMCNAPTGRTLAVDVDGQVHGCAVFVESYQKVASPFLRGCIAAIRLGDFRERGFAARLARYSELTRATGIFHDKRRKASPLGRCAECRFLDACSVCPASIGHIPGNADPRRVPALPCAFNRAVLACRERFIARVLAATPRPSGGFVTRSPWPMQPPAPRTAA